MQERPPDLCPFSGFRASFGRCADYVPRLAPARSRAGRSLADCMACAFLTSGAEKGGRRLYARCRLGGPAEEALAPA